MKASEEMAIEVSQRVDGTPDVVFPYFTDSEKYVQWKGLEAELDPRPGGVYRVKMWNGGWWAEGKFLVVEPPHKLVFSWGWRGVDLPPGMDDVPPGSTTVEVTFIADGDGTIIQLRHTGLAEEQNGMVHRFGWTLFLKRLRSLRAGHSPTDQMIEEVSTPSS
jgi:uncharacterized protein YndB with AHSA1/START domain